MSSIKLNIQSRYIARMRCAELQEADCEKILAEYQSEDFTTVTIRPATVCGYSPRQRLDVVVNILTNLAYHKRQISVFGGEQLFLGPWYKSLFFS